MPVQWGRPRLVMPLAAKHLLRPGSACLDWWRCIFVGLTIRHFYKRHRSGCRVCQTRLGNLAASILVQLTNFKWRTGRSQTKLTSKIEWSSVPWSCKIAKISHRKNISNQTQTEFNISYADLPKKCIFEQNLIQLHPNLLKSSVMWVLSDYALHNIYLVSREFLPLVYFQEPPELCRSYGLEERIQHDR